MLLSPNRNMDEDMEEGPDTPETEAPECQAADDEMNAVHRSLRAHPDQVVVKTRAGILRVQRQRADVLDAHSSGPGSEETHGAEATPAQAPDPPAQQDAAQALLQEAEAAKQLQVDFERRIARRLQEMTDPEPASQAAAAATIQERSEVASELAEPPTPLPMPLPKRRKQELAHRKTWE